MTSNIKKFKKPVTICFPHWVNIVSEEDKEKMFFLISDINSSETNFMKGCFEIAGSFGSIKIDHFCLISICIGNFIINFITSLISAIFQFFSHITSPTQLPVMKSYLDLLILPDCHNEMEAWNGIYCITLNSFTYVQVTFIILRLY